MELGEVLDLWIVIFDYCDMEDLINFLQVNKNFYEIIKRKLNIKAKEIFDKLEYNGEWLEPAGVRISFVLPNNSFIFSTILYNLSPAYYVCYHWRNVTDREKLLMLGKRTWRVADMIFSSSNHKHYHHQFINILKGNLAITLDPKELIEDELTPGKLKMLLYVFGNC